MGCPDIERWRLLAMEQLPEDESAGLLAHARTCERCGLELSKARREHVDLVRMYEAYDRDHDELREQLMAALPNRDQAAARASGLRVVGRRLGEIIMNKNQTTGRRIATWLAPAACIVLAAAVFFTPKESVFAAALERMRQANTIVCDISTYMNDSEEPVMEGTMFMSSEYGSRIDMDLGVFGGLHRTGDDEAGSSGDGFTFVRKPDGPALMLNSQMNLAIRMHGLDEMGGSPQSTSPDEFIRHCLELTGEADASLGQSVIGDRIVEGFEVSGERLWDRAREMHGGLHGRLGMHAIDKDSLPEMAFRLWIDVETNLPVRIEADVKVKPFGMSVRAVHDGFEWDTPLEAELFDVETPEGMQVLDLVIPPMSEETLVEALRVYSEETGLYPASLDPGDVGAQVVMASSVGRKIASRLHEGESGALDQAAIHGEVMRNALTLGMAFHFVKSLEEAGQAPEYFGDIVTPLDVDDVLMHWRLEDGRMRVIYGDLSVETASTTD